MRTPHLRAGLKGHECRLVRQEMEALAGYISTQCRRHALVGAGNAIGAQDAPATVDVAMVQAGTTCPLALELYLHQVDWALNGCRGCTTNQSRQEGSGQRWLSASDDFRPTCDVSFGRTIRISY